MTTTPPPMPPHHIWEHDSFGCRITGYTEQQMIDRDAQWMERITALEADISRFHQAMKDAGWHPGRTDDLLTDIIRAKGEAMRNLKADRKMLREALTVAVTQNEHDMLMTGDELRAARTAMENTK